MSFEDKFIFSTKKRVHKKFLYGFLEKHINNDTLWQRIKCFVLNKTGDNRVPFLFMFAFFFRRQQ